MLSKCRKPVNISIRIIFILLPKILNQEQEKHWTRRKVVSGKILTEQTLNQTLDGKNVKTKLTSERANIEQGQTRKNYLPGKKSVRTYVGPGQKSNETKIKQGQDEDKRWYMISNIRGQT